MAELNSFSTGGAPGESGSTPNFSSALSPAPYTRNSEPQAPTVNGAPNGRPKSDPSIPSPFDFGDIGAMPEAPGFPPGYDTASFNPYSPTGFEQPPPPPDFGDGSNLQIEGQPGAPQPQAQAQPQPQQAQAPVQQPAQAAPAQQQPAGMAPAPGQPAPAAVAPAAPAPRAISKLDVEMLPAGMSLDSHIGTISRNSKGELSIQLSPEGQKIHDGLVAQVMSKFGYHYGHDDPKAPKPPIIPGRAAYNPFTNQWTDGWDPEAEFGAGV